MIKQIALSLALLPLVACAPVSPYTKGKSSADVPSHVDKVYLETVYIMSGDAEANGEPKVDASPSQDSQDMLPLAKPAIVSQLTNFGYKVVEDSNAKADVGVKCAVRYVHLWPLANNTMNTWCGLYDVEGALLFKMMLVEERQSGLVTMLVEQSRTDMAVQEARDTIVKVVDEMRKGTK